MQNNNKTFFFDKIVVSSDFQSGNLAKALQKDQTTFQLWIQPDPNSTYKTWFYFSIQQIPQQFTITFIIKNMSNQLKLLKQGHLPVVKTQSSQKWERIKIPIQQNGIAKSNEGYEVTFKHTFHKKQKHYFAFSYPFSNWELERLIQKLMCSNKQKIYSNYSVIGHSFQKRPLKLLTITNLTQSFNNKWKEFQIAQMQHKPIVVQDKKGIFISARVHPGQVASSHILNGFLNFLFDYNIQAQILLKKFVFYIIPIINPDGVAMGNFRTNANGKNLNRFYTDPKNQTEPEIYTIKKFLLQMIKNKHIEFCLDLHAHVNKQGAFIYGNSIGDLKGQVQVCLFPKILAYNCEFFDFDACNFSQKNMTSKDKIDQLSKQGASRVAIYKQTGLKNCWTLQCNYNSAKFINQLNKKEPQIFKSVSNGVITQKTFPIKKEQQTFYTLSQLQLIGKNIAQSILDYYDLREMARYYSGKLKNRQNFELNLAVQVLRMIPFRFDNNCRKLLNILNSNINISQILEKISKMLSKAGENSFLTKKENMKMIREQSSKKQSLLNIKNIHNSNNNMNQPPIQKKTKIILQFSQENKEPIKTKVMSKKQLPTKKISCDKKNSQVNKKQTKGLFSKVKKQSSLMVQRKVSVSNKEIFKKS